MSACCPETRSYQLANHSPEDRIAYLQTGYTEVTYRGPLKTVSEYLWESLRSKFDTSSPKPKPSLEELKETQWCKDFEQLMRNRLVMGAMRYETFEEKREKGCNYDYIASTLSRLEKYKKDGNLEHLVDAANCLLLEFEFGSHPNRHFAAVDDGEHVTKKG